MTLDELKYSTKVCLLAVFHLIFWLILLFLLTRPANASAPPLTDQNAILAIIGEAEGEPQIGRIAVGEVIRRRRSLKGVYGVNAPRVKARKFSQTTWDACAAAWRASSSTNYSKGAMGWGNAADFKIFRRQAWFRNKKIVCKIGNHSFWK